MIEYTADKRQWFRHFSFGPKPQIALKFFAFSIILMIFASHLAAKFIKLGALDKQVIFPVHIPQHSFTLIANCFNPA